MSRWDAVVVGGGPSGSFVARALARADLRVLLVERSAWPRWKVCGACVGPAARTVLAGAGLAGLEARAGAVPLRSATLRAGERSASVPLHGWAAWSRSAMDAALLDAARAAGAVCRTGASARIGRVRGDARVVLVREGSREEVVRAAVVVDASGLAGAGDRTETGDRAAAGTGARAATGARARAATGTRDRAATGTGGAAAARAPGRPTAAPRVRIGLGALYPASASTIERSALHMVVGRGGYVGLVRLEDDTVDVAVAVDPSLLSRARPEEVVAELLRRSGLELEGPPVRGWRGTPYLTRTASRAAAERLFAVGDALSYVEPFTGEGIGWALEGARALAPIAAVAARRWEPSLRDVWTRTQARRVARRQRLCRLTAPVLRRPRLVSLAMRALTLAPGLARPWTRPRRSLAYALEASA